jgi:hypothetical protein
MDMAKAKNAKKSRVRLHEASVENDIKYRGPLSYQHFQIFGWLCIVLSVALMMLKLGAKADESLARDTADLITVLEYLTSLSLPFLLIANFSRILNNSEGYKKQLIRNGAAAVGLGLAVYIFFNRYVVSAAGKLVEDPENVLPVMTSLFRGFSGSGFMAINLFVDLFLCTLFMFFLNARPKHVFTGKKVLLFRFFALLPIAYEIISIMIKFKAARGDIMLPIWSFSLLTVKPPMTFVVFVLLATYMKTRELHFCKHGRTHEEYHVFLQTNRNSKHFSVYLSVVLVIAAVLDFIMMIVMMFLAAPSADALVSAETEEMMRLAHVAMDVGFGGSVMLIVVAPIMLLYSYTRMPKNKMISTLIPAVGIALIILIVIEGIYQILGYLPIQKINIQQTMEIIIQASE